MSNALPGVNDSPVPVLSPQRSIATSPPTPASSISSDLPASSPSGRAQLATLQRGASLIHTMSRSRRIGAKKSLVALLVMMLGFGLNVSAATAHLSASPLRTAVKTASRTVKVKPKPKRKVAAKPAVKTSKNTTSAKTKVTAQKVVLNVTKPKVDTPPPTSSELPTSAPTTIPQARILPTPVLAGVAATVPLPPAVLPVSDVVINPLPAVAATVAPVGAGTAITTPPVATTTTTTSIPPAPFPAPADPPKRVAAGTLDPYRGLGAWVDRLDWSNLFGKNKPAVTLATIDQMADAGIQTIYIQIPHWQTTPDIYELDRLQPLIDRAHARGMYVVGWYLPFLFDVNTDLRKVVAMANLDIDGIQIDIEPSGLAAMANVNLRNARLTEFNRSLRSLLPGRIISADIVPPTWMDGQVDRWSWPNYPAKTRPLFWGGPFPYAEIVATYDLVALQLYWTENSANSGWRDAQVFVTENMNRMRAYSGRPDYPIQAIGGVNTAKSPLNDVIGYADAAKATGSFGFSFYDWTTTPAAWWPAMWGLRSAIDPRFPAPALAPYAPLVFPPTPPVTTTTTTTTTTTKPPANVQAAAATSTLPTLPAQPTQPIQPTQPPIEIIIK